MKIHIIKLSYNVKIAYMKVEEYDELLNVRSDA